MDKIVGNEKLIDNMINTINNNKMNHSYILEGGEGTGKTTIGKFFAKAILCESDKKPCDSCHSCISFDTDNNPDFFYITTEKKSLGVADIRKSITATVNIKPFRSNKKVYLIEDSDSMTIAAQNAFLKTLEEPPEFVVFILTANNKHNLLTTIISRCITLNTVSLSEQSLYKAIDSMQNKCENDLYLDKNVAVKLADGSIGKYLSTVCNEDFINNREKLLQIVENIKKYDIIDIIQKSDELAKNKIDNQIVYDVLLSWYRDLLVYKSTNNINLCLNIDKKQYIIDNDIYIKKIYSKIDALSNFKNGYTHTVNQTMNLNILFLKLREV